MRALYYSLLTPLALLTLFPQALSARNVFQKKPYVEVHMEALEVFKRTPANAVMQTVPVAVQESGLAKPYIPPAPAPTMEPPAPIQAAPPAPAAQASAPVVAETVVANPSPASESSVALPVAQHFQPLLNRGSIEAGASYYNVSDKLGDWRGTYVQGEWQANANHRLNGEISYLERFKDEGIYAAIGDTFVINDDWYAALSVGGSTAGFFLPRYRVDGSISRKWLPRRSLVTTVGGGVYDARDVYRDQSLFFNATYYFDAPWIVQAGFRYNVSSPGSVDSTSQFLALTYGRNKQYYLSGSYSFGNESYQVIAPNSPISDINSDELTLAWKQWLAPDMGFNLRGTRYDNSSYDRTGVSLGFFKEF